MLEIITSSALKTTHGFFTRKGGASSGVFAGLNCGTGSTDQAEIVAINRARVAEAMGVAETGLLAVHQVHSADVVTASEASLDRPRADALVTNQKGLALSILTADCQPVLFADQKAGVIGAAHAGWRGAVDGILDATLNSMVKLGANRQDITAVIGPCISQKAYEVGQEFFDTFMVQDPANSRFFINGEAGKYLFDLPSYGLYRLREAGVGHAEWIGHCTYSDPDRFFSYRRTTHAKEADYGRLISVIKL